MLDELGLPQSTGCLCVTSDWLDIAVKGWFIAARYLPLVTRGAAPRLCASALESSAARPAHGKPLQPALSGWGLSGAERGWSLNGTLRESCTHAQIDPCVRHNTCTLCVLAFDMAWWVESRGEGRFPSANGWLRYVRTQEWSRHSVLLARLQGRDCERASQKGLFPM